MSKLVWIDIETTGLDPMTDAILEIAVVVTGEDLAPIAAREWVIAVPASRLSRMDPYVLKMHEENGLVADVTASKKNHEAVEDEVLGVLRIYCGMGCVLAGSSVHFDRSFIRAQMPELHAALHYHHFDVSVLHRAYEMWMPKRRAPKHTMKAHRAMADILQSLEHARWYRGAFQAMGHRQPQCEAAK